MATMPAASVLGEDGGRSAGEVAPGVTLVKNVRIPVREVRAWQPTSISRLCARGGDPVSLVMEYIPYRKDEVAPGHRFYEYLPQQGTRSPASTSAEVALRRARRATSTCCRSSSTESIPSSGSAGGHGAPGT